MDILRAFLHHRVQSFFLLGAAIGVAVGLAFFAGPPLIRDGRNFAHDLEVEAVTATFDAESLRLQKNASELAVDSFVLRAIQNENALDLTALAVQEAKRRDVDGISFIDQKGIVLSRSLQPSKRGDYIFDKTSWGVEVAKGRSTTAFEQGVTGTLMLRSVSPIFANGAFVGAVSVLRIFNDSFLERIRESSLPQNTDIALYGTAGVSASSFHEESVRANASKLFSNTATILSIKGSIPEKEVQFKDAAYGLRLAALGGLESGTGGVMIFHQHRHIAEAVIVATFLAAFFFLFLVVVYRLAHGLRKQTRHTHLFEIVFSTLLVFVFSNMVLVIHFDENKFIADAGPSSAIYNSIISFSPEWDVIDEAYEQQVSIVITSGGETVNAVTAEVHFNPEALQISDLLMTRSICAEGSVLEKSIDNKKGVVTMSCIIPNPGFTGQGGVVADLLVQPIRAGTFSFVFGTSTQVLANDGLGTNVLRDAQNAYFRVLEANSATTSPHQFTFFSKTHPNGARWYASRAIALAWRHTEGATYRYVFDDNPDTIPNASSPSTNLDSFTLIAPKDGVQYLHVVKRLPSGTEELIHRPFLIDTTAPPLPTIQLSSDRVRAGDIVRVDLKNNDTSATSEPGFYIRLGTEGVFLPVKPPLYIPFSEPGTFTLHVKVFDKAGNSTENTATVTVLPMLLSPL